MPTYNAHLLVLCVIQDICTCACVVVHAAVLLCVVTDVTSGVKHYLVCAASQCACCFQKCAAVGCFTMDVVPFGLYVHAVVAGCV